MNPDVIAEAKKLYEGGDISEALEFYGMSILRKQAGLELVSTWFSDEDIVKKAGERAVCRFIAMIMFAIDECPEKQRNILHNICLNAVNKIDVCEARNDTTDRYTVESILYKHMQKPEEALNAALRGLKKEKTPSRATFAGISYIEMDDAENAEKYISMGYEMDKSNASGYNDLGDYYFDKENYSKAGECYYKVLESNDFGSCEWAEPSWLFCNFMHTGSGEQLERLAVYTAANIDNYRAENLCRRAYAEFMVPYVDYICQSDEAVINGLRSVRKQNGKMGGKLYVSCQESASSINAIRLSASCFNEQDNSYNITIGAEQNPSLNETVSSDGVVLWDYSDISNPVPAVDKPSEFISKAVKELAKSKYSLESWYDKAEKIAEELTEEHIKDLYSVMVYPPKPDDVKNTLAEEWLMAVQYAAVCILSRISLNEIERICNGQLDWPIIPAITLAGWLAKKDEKYEKWGEDILLKVKDRISKENYCFFKHAHICAMRLLPNKSKQYYEDMWQLRLEYENS